MRAANFCDLAASPIMIGTIGCTPGLIVRPRSVTASRKYFVFSSSLSRSSVDAVRISSAFKHAATIGGATVLENKYGRERCRKRSTICLRPLVKPPLAPPSAFERAGDDVDLAHHTAIFVRAAAGLAEEPG